MFFIACNIPNPNFFSVPSSSIKLASFQMLFSVVFGQNNRDSITRISMLLLYIGNFFYEYYAYLLILFLIDINTCNLCDKVEKYFHLYGKMEDLPSATKMKSVKYCCPHI